MSEVPTVIPCSHRRQREPLEGAIDINAKFLIRTSSFQSDNLNIAYFVYNLVSYMLKYPHDSPTMALYLRGNDALNINPSTGVSEALSVEGSDWLWAVTGIYLIAFVCFFVSSLRPLSQFDCSRNHVC